MIDKFETKKQVRLRAKSALLKLRSRLGSPAEVYNYLPEFGQRNIYNWLEDNKLPSYFASIKILDKLNEKYKDN